MKAQPLGTKSIGRDYSKVIVPLIKFGFFVAIYFGLSVSGAFLVDFCLRVLF